MTSWASAGDPWPTGHVPPACATAASTARGRVSGPGLGPRVGGVLVQHRRRLGDPEQHGAPAVRAAEDGVSEGLPHHEPVGRAAEHGPHRVAVH